MVQDGKHEEPTVLLWIEFVDRDVQPNYIAQRGVDMKKVPTYGMNSEEMVALAIQGTVTAVVLGIELAEMVG